MTLMSLSTCLSLLIATVDLPLTVLGKAAACAVADAPGMSCFMIHKMRITKITVYGSSLLRKTSIRSIVVIVRMNRLIGWHTSISGQILDTEYMRDSLMKTATPLAQSARITTCLWKEKPIL